MRAGSRNGCERTTRPSTPRARTIAWRPRKRISTEPGSTSSEARMRRRTTSDVSQTDVASAANAGGWVRASRTAAGSLALAVGDDRRPTRRSALVIAAVRPVPVIGTNTSVCRQRPPDRGTIRLPTDTQPPQGLGVVCRTQPTSFRGALVRAVARAYRGTPPTTPGVRWTPVASAHHQAFAQTGAGHSRGLPVAGARSRGSDSKSHPSPLRRRPPHVGMSPRCSPHPLAGLERRRAGRTSTSPRYAPNQTRPPEGHRSSRRRDTRSRPERRERTNEHLLLRKLSRHDDNAAIAEMRDGAARQQTMRRDPVIPPRDAAAQAQYGFGDDLDVLQLDSGSDAHGALLFGVRAEHTWVGARCRTFVALRG